MGRERLTSGRSASPSCLMCFSPASLLLLPLFSSCLSSRCLSPNNHAQPSEKKTDRQAGETATDLSRMLHNYVLDDAGNYYVLDDAGNSHREHDIDKWREWMMTRHEPAGREHGRGQGHR